MIENRPATVNPRVDIDQPYPPRPAPKPRNVSDKDIVRLKHQHKELGRPPLSLLYHFIFIRRD